MVDSIAHGVVHVAPERNLQGEPDAEEPLDDRVVKVARQSRAEVVPIAFGEEQSPEILVKLGIVVPARDLVGSQGLAREAEIPGRMRRHARQHDEARLAHAASGGRLENFRDLAEIEGVALTLVGRVMHGGVDNAIKADGLIKSPDAGETGRRRIDQARLVAAGLEILRQRMMQPPRHEIGGEVPQIAEGARR